MILDLLLEKKDLLIYIDNRIIFLNKTLRTEIKKTIPKDREKLVQRHIGRIKELRLLKGIIHDGRVKDMGKIYWEKLNAIYKIP